MATKQQKRLAPIHPGEVLQDLLTEAGLTANSLAIALRVPANRIGGILKGQRGITADTALRLARYFGTSAQMWVNLQAKYESGVGRGGTSQPDRQGSSSSPRSLMMVVMMMMPRPRSKNRVIAAPCVTDAPSLGTSQVSGHLAPAQLTNDFNLGDEGW